MFRPTVREVTTPNGGTRLDPCYDLTRDGFTLLAMGFTGPKALGFKLRYIEAFNAMEATLKAGIPGDARINPAVNRHALDLMERLKRESNPTIRRSIHDMLAMACKQIGIATPPLDAIGRDAPPPAPLPPILVEFWAAIAALEGAGIDVNHSPDPSLIALNLPELAKRLTAGPLTITIDGELRHALRRSTAPRFVAERTVRSRLVKDTVRCWVFRVSA